MLFICSVIFIITCSVDCRRGTNTREGRREGIRGEGREDWGRKYVRHMNFQKFLTTKPSTRNHPFLASKCSKTHLQQSKNKNFLCGYYPQAMLQGKKGGRGRTGEWLKGKGTSPQFCIRMYAYEAIWLLLNVYKRRSHQARVSSPGSRCLDRLGVKNKRACLANRANLLLSSSLLSID